MEMRQKQVDTSYVNWQEVRCVEHDYRWSNMQANWASLMVKLVVPLQLKAVAGTVIV